MHARPVNMSARALATRVLTEVIITGKNLDYCLDKYLATVDDIRSKSLTQEICYGVMRWYFQLEFIVNALITKPLKHKDTDLYVLMLSGIYQYKFLRTPDHAAINETVQTTREIGKPWASSLVNAVMRRYQREQDKIEKSIIESDVARYAFPAWFIDKVAVQWPENWQSILTASNEYPPMQLRINTENTSRQNYIQELQSKGIDAKNSTLSSEGISLINPMNVVDIPRFKEGCVSVQDFGAQLAATLLDCNPGHRVLDACAAPGGKTGHILEMCAKLSELVAIDIDQNRIDLVNDNLNRIKKTATVMQADIRDIGTWWDNDPFDRILLDAPCSASGIIRRHPDIKYLRTLVQIPALVAVQKGLLESLWQVLKSRGKLLYCTCSIFREESDEQIAQFINQYNNVKVLPIDANWGVKTRYGRQTLPGSGESDGFYYSLLEKT